MAAATTLAEAFGEGACLYETVLNVPKDATPSQLRKAYYKKALQYHPDKQAGASSSDIELAKVKFQAISLAYAILSDPEKKAEYDESGELWDEDDHLTSRSGVQQWKDYFRGIFPTVTTSDIDAFEVRYKCSDEEHADVLKYYSQFKGDLNKMLECVLLSTDADKRRWLEDYIRPAVDRGEVPDFQATIERTLGNPPKKKLFKSRKNKRPVQVDAEEIGESDSDEVMAEIVEDDDPSMGEEEVQVLQEQRTSSSLKNKAANAKFKPKKKSSTVKRTTPSKHRRQKKANAENLTDESLIAQIRGNALARKQAGFNSLMADLEEKYAGSSSRNSGKRSKGKQVDDISDDEFHEIQKKLIMNAKSKRKNKP